MADEMSHAPKDSDILLLLPGGANQKAFWSIGKWDDDQYANKPRPYWRADIERVLGKVWMRNSQPLRWEPLPSIPENF